MIEQNIVEVMFEGACRSSSTLRTQGYIITYTPQHNENVSFLIVSAKSKVVDCVKTQKLHDPILIIGRSWAFTMVHPRCAIAKSVTILAQENKQTFEHGSGALVFIPWKNQLAKKLT